MEGPVMTGLGLFPCISSPFRSGAKRNHAKAKENISRNLKWGLQDVPSQWNLNSAASKWNLGSSPYLTLLPLAPTHWVTGQRGWHLPLESSLSLNQPLLASAICLVRKTLLLILSSAIVLPGKAAMSLSWAVIPDAVGWALLVLEYVLSLCIFCHNIQHPIFSFPLPFLKTVLVPQRPFLLFSCLPSILLSFLS